MRFTFLRDRMYASNYYISRSSLSTLFSWTNLPRFVTFLLFQFAHWPILKHTTVSHEMVRTRHSSLYFFAQQDTFAPGSSVQDTVIHTTHAEGSCRHSGMSLVQPKIKSLSVDPQCFTRIGGWFLISCSNVNWYKLSSTTIKLTVVRRTLWKIVDTKNWNIWVLVICNVREYKNIWEQSPSSDASRWHRIRTRINHRGYPQRANKT